MTNTLTTIITDNNASKFVLDSLNKEIDSEGYIIEKDTKQRVITPTGEELKFSDFAGVRPGSEIFIKSNIVSLVELASDLI